MHLYLILHKVFRIIKVHFFLWSREFLPAQIPLSNRFDILCCDDLEESRSEFDEVSLSITNIKKLNAGYHRFSLGSWNVQSLNCTRKQVEIGEILYKNNIDLLVYRRVGR